MIAAKTGILLTNIGTPQEPTSVKVREYLKRFLSDKRVVEFPRPLWWPILYGFILPFRSPRSAKLYQKIWTQQGSPLLIYSQNIAEKLQKQLQIPVALGMHYSSPSIDDALQELRAKAVTHVLVLPLYPQYSATTTASTFDLVTASLRQWRVIPEIRMINHYADDPHYIKAWADTIRDYWKSNNRAPHLLFSFHGIPKYYADAGDPYPILCQHTAHAIANELQLSPSEWTLSYQSRLGRTQWLTPYTDKLLNEFPKKGIHHLDVVCPGFATDCLETLEEINIRGKEQFINAGGQSFQYIPSLNDSEYHINMLTQIITKNLWQDWIK